MRVRSVALISLSACTATASADGIAVPLRAPSEPSCPPDRRPFGADCLAPDATVAWDPSGPRPITLRLHPAGGAWWWWSPDLARRDEAAAACEAAGASLFVPTDLRTLGVAVHFAVLTQPVALDLGVWIGLDLDLRSGVVVDGQGRGLYRWQATLPPSRGPAGEGEDEAVQALLDATAAGEASGDDDLGFLVGTDGATRLVVGSAQRATALCMPRP